MPGQNLTLDRNAALDEIKMQGWTKFVIGEIVDGEFSFYKKERF